MKKVTVKLLNHGGYDGLKGVEFPQVVEGFEHPTLDYIDVPFEELERIGYDKAKGRCCGNLPDCAEGSPCLTFFKFSEAEVIA
ncbi:hypothetical protein HOT14_gp03 [Escherichia phage vB_EcoS_IME347]|uniref:Uncharacterized protein n=1 Tax=Escherichia phage vB_EcoS_IME347 TaxID=2496546 RepID=A0A2S1GS41_9CAUD|nr:hypothetical protein HOT14_gp03 [Escherichia phage vB_EcoS_IME347]AWD92203.1 hypothetical protein [Escherichia phage vB_EcoS_IME347]